MVLHLTVAAQFANSSYAASEIWCIIYILVHEIKQLVATSPSHHHHMSCHAILITLGWLHPRSLENRSHYCWCDVVDGTVSLMTLHHPYGVGWLVDNALLLP